MKKVLIAGYFGMGNLGDEAILQGEYEWLKNNLPGIEISVLSGNPIKTSSELGIYAYDRKSFRDTFHAISKCDLFILGGGGLFQDVTSFRSLLYYLFLIEYARMKRKKIAIFAVGIGPLKRKISEHLVKRAFKKANYVSLRDNDSFAWAKRRGIEGVYLSADASFLLSPPLPGERKDEVAISLRLWPGLSIEGLEKSLKWLSMKKGLKLTYLLFNPADEEISRKLQTETGGEINLLSSPREALGRLSKCRFTIAMRLHSGILSAVAGTPFLGLAYNQKVEAIANELGQLSLPLAESNKLVNSLEYLLEKEETIRDSLKDKCICMRKRIEGTMEGIKALLEED